MTARRVCSGGQKCKWDHMEADTAPMEADTAPMEAAAVPMEADTGPLGVVTERRQWLQNAHNRCVAPGFAHDSPQHPQLRCSTARCRRQAFLAKPACHGRPSTAGVP